MEICFIFKLSLLLLILTNIYIVIENIKLGFKIKDFIIEIILILLIICFLFWNPF